VETQRRIPASPLWDTTTPEYTGPLVLGPKTQGSTFPASFPAAFSRYCQATGIVAEFAHLNPWSARLDLLDAAFIEDNREIIYIDLTLGEEATWKHSLSSDARRQTRQAMDAGVRGRPAESIEDVLAFHRLHQQTMERLSAQEHYFLPAEYFLAIFETMPRNAVFMLSEYQGRIVAGGLYFQDATDVYWHLSAVDMEFSRVRPVNAFHYETIRQAGLAGKQRMLCGGAHKSGDGVFRFKAGFSPLRIPFRIYKRIHDPETYAALMREWVPGVADLPMERGFFPAYRSVV
jgi:lipid II:glycine glycyltransferase (peptidoglycan interpeptide bridge formation enzyme)